ncbi:hypothetical protein CRU87_00480 [Aliarcobacter trophiarum LMG 25534]|uniref:Uncharacterized protein n=1 Tax=Aliarcobacter trophiarum LMG 25534 TaxID=1032241 RepID=A0AAD0VLY3_9BACT|nr:hypothetical protein [Aliarcobacter trophiarum]AXK48330.1 hypothetical protein ATR_0446 [Aliarcobacter trophiarum LMG 25534]RXI28607.1 hypothetical protein CRU89_01225 [Aliarcobacter trophiarum]RXJ92994.1 hypothetical protein CRU87_00480 [Aliarcobacter trophiarum LMG 25534]
MFLGKCPNCNSKVIAINKKEKKDDVVLYTCESSIYSKQGIQNSSFIQSYKYCNFKIFSNVILKTTQKDGLNYHDISTIENSTIAINLYSKKIKGEDLNYVFLDRDYGVSILWDE